MVSLGSRRWLVLAAVIVVIFGSWLYWTKYRTANTKAPDYLTATVEKGDIEDTVLASGTLEAQKLVSVGSQASGQVEHLYVRLGDKVRKGQLIAQIDPLTQQNALATSQSELANQQAQRAVREAALEQARLAFQREKNMLAQDATSRASFEAAQADYRSAQAQLAAVNQQIRQASLTVNSAQLKVGYTRILAPMDGTVVAIVTEEGQTVNANQSAPTIIKLANLDSLQVEAQISEADVMKVKPGQNVYFTTLGDPDRKYYATLRSIEPAPASIVSESSTSSSSSSSSAVYYNGLFDVPNPDGSLHIDMTAQVYIVLNEAHDALLIPSAALTQGKGKGNKRTKETDKQTTTSSTATNSTGVNSRKINSGNTATDSDMPRHSRKPLPEGSHFGRVHVLTAQGQPEERNVVYGINNRVQAQILSGLKEGEKVIIGESSNTPSAASTQRAKRAAGGGPRPMGL